MRSRLGSLWIPQEIWCVSSWLCHERKSNSIHYTEKLVYRDSHRECSFKSQVFYWVHRGLKTLATTLHAHPKPPTGPTTENPLGFRPYQAVSGFKVRIEVKKGSVLLKHCWQSVVSMSLLWRTQQMLGNNVLTKWWPVNLFSFFPFPSQVHTPAISKCISFPEVL